MQMSYPCRLPRSARSSAVVNYLRNLHAQSTILVALVLVACNRDRPAAESTPAGIECTTPQIVGRLPAELNEASGLAASLRTPGIWWTVNDDGAAQLVAIDSTG